MSRGDEEGGDRAAFFMDETAEKGLSLASLRVSQHAGTHTQKTQSKSAL